MATLTKPMNGVENSWRVHDQEGVQQALARHLGQQNAQMIEMAARINEFAALIRDQGEQIAELRVGKRNSDVQITNLQGQIDAMRTELDGDDGHQGLRGEVQGLRGEVIVLNADNNRLVGEVAALRNDLVRERNEKANVTGERDQARAERDAAQAEQRRVNENNAELRRNVQEARSQNYLWEVSHLKRLYDGLQGTNNDPTRIKNLTVQCLPVEADRTSLYKKMSEVCGTWFSSGESCFNNNCWCGTVAHDLKKRAIVLLAQEKQILPR